MANRRSFTVDKEDDDALRYMGRRACRACDDFKSWRKNHSPSAPDKATKQNSIEVNTTQERDDCPLDIQELGSNTWSFLHTMAAYYPEKPSDKQKKDMTSFIYLFSKFYPCEHCAVDFQNSIKEKQPDVRDRYTLSDWFCQQHNIVNRKLSKPEFDCSKVMERWRDGWKDGSCD